MCGYGRRHISNADLTEFVRNLELAEAFRNMPLPLDNVLEHFYPAFGGAASRRITSMIIQEEGKLISVDATWWFDCQEVDGTLVVNNKRTTFNARNLASSYWKGAIRHNRGIALFTGIGEGKVICSFHSGCFKSSRESTITV